MEHNNVKQVALGIYSFFHQTLLKRLTIKLTGQHLKDFYFGFGFFCDI